MTSSPRSTTQPPIHVVQNSDRASRLLAAQRRLYSDAKAIHSIRLAAIGLGALCSVIAAILIPEHRLTVGLATASTLMLISLLGSSREKRRSREAASVQEEFDTYVFQLPWNGMLADRPSPTLVAEAARRYDGPDVSNWYPSTGTVVRPLDVLICQRSNVGWGASMHRTWAGVLSGGLAAVSVLCIVLGVRLGLPFGETLATIVAPCLAPIREIADLVKLNADNARTKATVEQKILDLWQRGLDDPEEVRESDCRVVQDRILTIRQANASIPDWLDRMRHDAQESTMRVSASHLIEEAHDRGMG